MMSCSISVSCCNNNFLSSPHSAQLSPGTLVTTHWTRIKDHTIGHSTSNSASSSKFHPLAFLVALVLPLGWLSGLKLLYPIVWSLIEADVEMWHWRVLRNLVQHHLLQASDHHKLLQELDKAGQVLFAFIELFFVIATLYFCFVFSSTIVII